LSGFDIIFLQTLKNAHLAIGGGGGVLIALPLLYFQGLEIPLPRSLEVPLLLGDSPQLVIGSRFPFRAVTLAFYLRSFAE
jgi:hypothetical protein